LVADDLGKRRTVKFPKSLHSPRAASGVALFLLAWFFVPIASHMPHCRSLAVRLDRRARAIERGFLQLRVDGARHVLVPAGLVPRVKAISASLCLHGAHDTLGGAHSHFARGAALGAFRGGHISHDELSAACQVHRRSNAAKHSCCFEGSQLQAQMTHDASLAFVGGRAKVKWADASSDSEGCLSRDALGVDFCDELRDAGDVVNVVSHGAPRLPPTASQVAALCPDEALLPREENLLYPDLFVKLENLIDRLLNKVELQGVFAKITALEVANANLKEESCHLKIKIEELGLASVNLKEELSNDFCPAPVASLAPSDLSGVVRYPDLDLLLTASSEHSFARGAAHCDAAIANVLKILQTCSTAIAQLAAKTKEQDCAIDSVVTLLERERTVSTHPDASAQCQLTQIRGSPPTAPSSASSLCPKAECSETHEFLEGQPVVLNGLKSTLFNGKCGLVVGSACPAGRVGILLWCESAPKMFPVSNVFALEPNCFDGEVCCGCRSPVSLLNSTTCLCGESSVRYQLFAKFGLAMFPEEQFPTPASEPSPPRAVQPLRSQVM
jgi:hypothetical protein